MPPLSPFTSEEVHSYLQFIALPASLWPQENSPRDFRLLEALHIHQISTIPYDNLSLHYSTDHKITLEPGKAYSKFLGGKGRGGYCMEVNLFFTHILRAIGFQVYPTGVRLRPRVDGVPFGDYMGLVHTVNIVTLENGEKYMLDAAFGGDGPTRPLLLEKDRAVQNLGTQEVRLTRATIPQLQTGQIFWIYQYRNASTSDWNSHYCFVETEYMLEDFDIINYFTSTYPGGFQVVTVLVVKFLRQDGKICGKIMMMNGTVKRNDGGKTRLVEECQSEQERVKALQKHFGISLTEEERAGIRGLATELNSF